MQVSSEAKLENLLGSSNPLKMLIMTYHIKAAVLKQCAMLTNPLYETMVYRLNLARCQFLHYFKQFMNLTFLSPWKKYFGMCENYEIQISMSTKKSFIGTKIHSFISIMSMVAFFLQPNSVIWQIWFVKPKILTTCPFLEFVASLCKSWENYNTKANIQSPKDISY